MIVEKSNGHSMTGHLKTVMVCPPRTAGWNQEAKIAHWRELGYFHEPVFPIAQTQHDRLCQILRDTGADVATVSAVNSISLDAVYIHDASLPTDFGVILMNPGKTARVPEAELHRNFYLDHGIAIFGEVTPPGTSEAGDIVWIDSHTLLVGHGYRTNANGIEQIRFMLASKGIEVISAPLPYGPGPSACLHLMSLMSMLGDETVLVDLPWLAVETVELLKSRGLRLLEIDYSERESLACNVLALGGKRLLAIAENVKTNQKLQKAGFEIFTFPGSEICLNGSGGPTCLTRPLLRS